MLVYKPHEYYSYLVRYIYHKPQLSHLCLNLGWLVVGTPTPLKNDGVKVSWDDEIYEIPNIYGEKNMFLKPATSSYNVRPPSYKLV